MLGDSMLTTKELILDTLHGFNVSGGDHFLEEIAEALEDRIKDRLHWQLTSQEVVDDITIAFWGGVYPTLRETAEVVAKRYDITMVELEVLLDEHFVKLKKGY